MINLDSYWTFTGVAFVVAWAVIFIIHFFGGWGAVFVGSVLAALILGNLAHDMYRVHKEERNYD